jgi:hypothetical protein
MAFCGVNSGLQQESKGEPAAFRIVLHGVAPVVMSELGAAAFKPLDGDESVIFEEKLYGQARTKPYPRADRFCAWRL